MMDQPSNSLSSDSVIISKFQSALEMLKEDRVGEAKELLEYNVMEGCTNSMVLLGTLLTHGNEQERRRSIFLFTLASNEDNNSGIRNLAYCYAIGLNVEKNKAKAAELYIKSAELGNSRSACNIGVMYNRGNGVTQDYNEAFYWYAKSADGGYPRGMCNLGEYYLWGRVTQKDVTTALRWFEKSGTPRAIYHIAEIYLDESGYRNDEKGLEALRKSAELGYSRALVRYGLLIEKEHPDTAIDYFTSAATKGNRDAVNCLVERGRPVPESRHGKKKSPQ